MNLPRDALTQSYARGALPVFAKHFIRESRRTRKPFSVAFIDIDHFKNLNDAFGHARGDEVLQHVVERINGAIRDEDLLVRYGGDEFVLLLPAADRPRASQICERLLERVTATPFRGEPPLSLTLSIGVASFPGDGAGPKALFERADARLYQAKRHGRDQVTDRDLDLGANLTFDQDARLLEREEPLAEAQVFLEQLAAAGRGILRLAGPSGVGHTRMLAEAARLARLRGYAVLEIRGSEARRSRHLGAIEEACFENRPLTVSQPNVVASHLSQALAERGRKGLFIALEGIGDIDSGSRDVIDGLLRSSIAPIGVAYTDTLNGTVFRNDASYRLTLTLRPLSRGAAGLWLRSLLQLDVPETFLGPFLAATHGLPARMRDALELLIAEGYLQRGPRSWQLPVLERVPLKRLLGLKQHPPPSRLPAWPGTLVGRKQELKRATDLLIEARLLTLFGPGGIGKTRLAVQLGREQLDRFPDGVFFVPLADLDGPDQLPDAITAAVGLQLPPEAPLPALAKALGERRLLLLLDGFERLQGAEAMVAALLEGTTGLRLLVTSREPLHLATETTFEVPPLGIPFSAEGVAFETYGAVQLFRQRAGRNLVTGDEEQEAILRICRLGDGVPLALELAAAWTPLMSCSEIAQALERDVALLGGEVLAGVMDFSWSLLSQEEQKKLCGLAVFRGSFTAEAAGAVTGASPFFLLALRDRSLLRLEDRRYSMHGLLRQHAREHLEDEGALRAAHARFFAGLAEALARKRGDDRSSDAYAAIDRDLENFKAAWDHALAGRQYALLPPMADVLRGYFDVRGRSREGLKLFAGGVEAVAEASVAEAPLLGQLKESLALFHYHLGELQEAAAQATAALELLTPPGPSEALALCTNTLAMILASSGDPAQGRELFVRARQIYREISDRLGEARVVGNIAVVAEQLGDLEDAEKAFRAAIALNRRLRNSSSVAVELLGLAGVQLRRDEPAEAEATYREALQLSREIGYLRAATQAFHGLGTVAGRQGRTEEALDAFLRASELAEHLGNRGRLAEARAHVIRTLLALGRLDQARPHLQQLMRAAAAGDTELDPLALGLLALLRFHEEDLAACARLLGALETVPAPLEPELSAARTALEERLGPELAAEQLARGKAEGAVSLLAEAETLAAT